MIKIDFRNEKNQITRSVNMPESWDEMSAAQVRIIFEKYEDLAGGKITRRQFEILAVYTLVGITRGPSALAARNAAIIENVTGLIKYVNFLFIDANPEIPVPQLSFKSIQNPLPSITVKGRKLYGPATLCQDLTFGEFRNAAMALNGFFNTEDIVSLDECIANLYRPRAAKANKAGRRVKPVKIETFEDDVAAVSTIKPWQKNLVMLWFASCINYLQSGTISLGGEEVDLKMLFSDSDEPGTQPATWNDLLLQVSREGTIGNIEAVDEAPLMMILLHMWSNYKENKRNERIIKKVKKTKRVP